MKKLIIISSIICLLSIITGLLISNTNFITEINIKPDKLIGYGTLGLFLFVFPIFSYYRWKDKKLKDYMLTKENLEKMRNRNL